MDEIIEEDNSRGVFNSLVGCLFARGVYREENIIDALGAIGIEKTKDDLDDLGKRIFKEKYRFRAKEGFTLSENKISKRFFEDCVHPGQDRSPDRGRNAAALPEEEGMGFSYSSTLASFISPRWTILSFISFSSIHPPQALPIGS